jgi:alkaline phosphatase
MKWAHKAGKSVGIVTTTHVTHATPSAGYAAIFNRYMESFDGKMLTQSDYDQGCRDIAHQLIENAEMINVRNFSIQKTT